MPLLINCDIDWNCITQETKISTYDFSSLLKRDGYRIQSRTAAHAHRLSLMIVNLNETPEGLAEVENPPTLQLCNSTIKRWLVETRPLGKRA